MNLLQRLFPPRTQTPSGPGLFQTVRDWLQNPRPPIAPTASILPVRLFTDERLQMLFQTPDPRRPRMIDILNKANLPGLNLLPPSGPRQ